MSQIADATDRLSYVVEMTEKAANRTMDLVEQSAPLVNQLGDDSREPAPGVATLHAPGNRR